MSGREQTWPERTRADAAGWVVRLQASGTGEADWLAFEAWLAATPQARSAYDAALEVWLLADGFSADEIDRHRRGGASPGSSWGADPGARRTPRFGGMAALGLGGLGAAITAMLVLTLHPATIAPSAPTSPSAATTYAAAAGERRAVTLADGTRMDLAGGSSVTVSLEPHARRVTMSDGEVAFQVAHDASRPFSVIIGDRQVRDLGTEFDIRRGGGQIRITVRQGKVEVAPREGAADAGAVAAPVDLGAGRQLVHEEGTDVSIVRSVAPEEVFAWKQGRLIYHDQPLRVVVEDLNRYFPHAVRIEGERVAAMRFTGVLTVDGEEATIRRLTALLPIEATRINGATVLKARDELR